MAARTLSLSVPYPPSANRYWRHRATGGHLVTYIAKEALEYRNEVRAAVLATPIAAAFEGHLTVIYDCYSPYPNKGDLGNAEKVLSDALTKAGVWGDDSQLWEIHLRRHYERGRVGVDVTVMEVPR